MEDTVPEREVQGSETLVVRYERSRARPFMPCPYKRPMDPEIQPLVDALNGTGIFSTYSSCGGHFPPPAGEPGKGIHAWVYFQPTDGHDETDVEKLRIYMHMVAMEDRVVAGWELEKHYWPYLDGDLHFSLLTSYRLVFMPPLDASDAEKRAKTSAAIGKLAVLAGRFPRARAVIV